MTVDDDIKSYEARQERARERAHEVKMRGHNARIERIKARRELGKSDKYLEHRFAVIAILGFTAFMLTVVMGIIYASTRPDTPPTPTEVQENQSQLQDQRERYEICMQVEKDQYVCDD